MCLQIIESLSRTELCVGQLCVDLETEPGTCACAGTGFPSFSEWKLF